MHFVDECASESKLDHENCWMSYGYPGWTCKKITNILFLESGDGDYENNQRYWYNYGKFNSKNEWVIDKSGIYKKLIHFAERNALNLCPYFRAEKVKAAVDQLRSKIVPDDLTFRVHYTDMYEGGEHLKFPDNIRHIPIRDYRRGFRRKYDLSRIRIIRRFESGEISAKAMNDLLGLPIEKN